LKGDYFFVFISLFSSRTLFVPFDNAKLSLLFTVHNYFPFFRLTSLRHPSSFATNGFQAQKICRKRDENVREKYKADKNGKGIRW